MAAAPPWAHHHRAHPHVRARAQARDIAGRIVNIDYGAAVMVVATRRGAVPVAVTPSTSIFHGAVFASFAELRPGTYVTVDVSNIGGRLVAQIIRVR